MQASAGTRPPSLLGRCSGGVGWGGVVKAQPLATSWEDGESQPSGVVLGSGATLSLEFHVERVL